MANYYISPTGNDDGGRNGGVGQEWATLYYACTRVTSSGDIIHVNAGSYTETSQSILSVGVSIEGVQGETLTSIITSSYTGGPLVLASSPDGTNGSQSISYLRFDGNFLTGHTAIRIAGRSNVKIHNCEIEDFNMDGVVFWGSNNYGVPSIYATGNEIYNCDIINCAGEYVFSDPNWWPAHGCLMVGGQDGLKIYNNTIESEDRGVNMWGFPIKFDKGGYNKGLKIYNNTLTCPPRNGSDWSFAIELFACRGGIEIYNNNIQGTVDFSSHMGVVTNDAGGFGYAIKIYNNTISYPGGLSDYIIGIDLERSFEGGVYIYNNWVQNFAYGFTTNVENSRGEYLWDLYIYYNIFHNIGRTSGYDLANGINLASDAPFENVNVWNNVVDGNAASVRNGIRLNLDDGTNISVRNNIIKDFTGSSYRAIIATGIYSGLSIENNLTYNCGGSSVIDVSGATGTITVQNNIIAENPDFVGGSPFDYHLTGVSPAIDTGISVGLTEDYAGNIVPYNLIPDIGAYEYVPIGEDFGILSKVNKWSII